MKTILVLLLTAAVAAKAQAQTTLTWYWTASQSGATVGSGEFTTADTYTGYAVPGTTWASPSASGTVPFYTITSASGEFDGLTITDILTDNTDGSQNYLFVSPNLWVNNVAGFNMDAGGVAFYLNGNTSDWIDLYSYNNLNSIDDNSEGSLTTFSDPSTSITVSDVAPVPEPSTFVLSAMAGVAGLLILRRR